MTTILRIDSSSRPDASSANGGEGSFSRTIANNVEKRLITELGSPTVIRRDLAAQPLPHISNTTIQGYYTSADAMTPDLFKATALSDALISEIEQADILLISIPIYNFSIPSAFKACVDQIVRIGRTFSYENGQFGGLVSGKRAYVCYSYGAEGYLDGGPLNGFDHMSPYVRMVLGFIGITDCVEFAIEATTAEKETVEVKMRRTLDDIDRRFAA